MTEHELDRHYKDAVSKSKTVFIEHAIDFFIVYLNVQSNSSFLPAAVLSAIDGRLGTLENRMSVLMYKQAAETDMLMSIAAACVKMDETYLRKQRAKSITNVKRTTGQLRFENIVRTSAASASADDYSDED